MFVFMSSYAVRTARNDRLQPVYTTSGECLPNTSTTVISVLSTATKRTFSAEGVEAHKPPRQA